MKKVIVYGVGKDYFKYESEIRKRYDVIYLMDSDPSREGELHGIPFWEVDRIGEVDFDAVVVVPSYHKMEIIQRLRSLGVPDTQIIPYVPFQSGIMPRVVLKLEEEACYGECGRVRFKLKHSSDFGVLSQVFAHTEYGLKTEKTLSVIDVGMNIGLTCLFFAGLDNVKDVYGFEPFPKTYSQALENFAMNEPDIRSKIRPCLSGLGNEARKLRQVRYSEDFSWGMRVDNLEAIEEEGGADVIGILRADEEIGRIIASCKGEKVVLKLDCEGSEYDILSVLESSEVLKEIDIVLMETHDFKEKSAVDILSRNGFLIFHQFIGTAYGLGMVYAARVNVE